MEENVFAPGPDGDIDALLDDWLSTPVPTVIDTASVVGETAIAIDAAAAPQVLAEGTLLEALAGDALVATPLADIGASSRASAARKDRYVVFTCGGSTYAVLESSVTEVGRIPKITLVPRVPGWLRGVTSLRGEVLSVVDLRMFLGLEPTSLHTGRLLVVRLTDEELSLGLLVDAVEQIASLPRDAVRPPASPLEGPLAPFLAGVTRVGDLLVAALDLDALLQAGPIRQFDDRKPE